MEQLFTSILNKAAQEHKLTNFSLNLNLKPDKGDGFLGEIYKVSILNNVTNTNIDLIVKKAPEEDGRREETCIDNAYKNEINFYSEIVPVLLQFQTKCQVSNIFDSIPKYFASEGEQGKEMILLEDITKLEYQIWPRDLVLNEEHARFIFNTYGRFHALSFCYKDQNLEDYRRLTKLCHNIMEQFKVKRGFSYSLQKIAEKSLKSLDPNLDGFIIEKYQKYVDSTMEIFAESIKYQGEHSTILHGDCWTNNMMFKYKDVQNKSKLDSIKLLDFQFIWIGTPVYDLSYFFYSGGSKELFKNLESYLDVYYESFSNFAQELGSDPKKIFPREILTREWKEYSKFGMLMSLLLTQVKLMSKNTSSEVAESISKKETDSSNDKFVNANINDNVFNERVRDILVHMHEIDAL